MIREDQGPEADVATVLVDVADQLRAVEANGWEMPSASTKALTVWPSTESTAGGTATETITAMTDVPMNRFHHTFDVSDKAYVDLQRDADAAFTTG